MTDIRRKLALFGFVLILLIAAACSLFAKPDYFPMSLNDVWKYEVTTQVTRWWGPGQPPFPTTDSGQSSVVLDTTLFGKPALKVLNMNDTVTAVNFVVKTATEVLIYGPDPADSPPQTGLKLPLAENSSWTADTVPRQGIMVCTVKNKEEVSVPAGTFTDAWLVETVGDSNPDLPQHRWFAKDVGMVKMVRTNRQVFGPETMETRITQELKSYTVQ
jgi:hypothetical protein